MGSVSVLRNSQVNLVHAEPVPYHLLLSFNPQGSSCGSCSSCRGIDSTVAYTGLEPKAVSQKPISLR